MTMGSLTDLALQPGDAEVLSSALRTSHTWALDALANCLLERGGARAKPNLEGARRCREMLDRIERLHDDLGGGELSTSRRERIEWLATNG